MDLDTLLYEFDVSDEVAVTVAADAGTTWDALMDADLLEVGRHGHLVAALGAVRMLPELANGLLHGRRPDPMPEHLTLRDTADGPPGSGSWTLLSEEPGRGIALGLVGRFWKPVIEYADVAAEDFAGFARPGYAKTIYVLTVDPVGDGRSRVRGAMRTVTTDEHARRWFRRYWTMGVGPGAHLLVGALLDLVRADAEARVADRAA